MASRQHESLRLHESGDRRAPRRGGDRYWFRLITWNPNGVSTAPLDSPTASANAASLNGLAIFSRVNLPTLP